MLRLTTHVNYNENTENSAVVRNTIRSLESELEDVLLRFLQRMECLLCLLLFYTQDQEPGKLNNNLITIVKDFIIEYLILSHLAVNYYLLSIEIRIKYRSTKDQYQCPKSLFMPLLKLGMDNGLITLTNYTKEELADLISNNRLKNKIEEITNNINGLDYDALILAAKDLTHKFGPHGTLGDAVTIVDIPTSVLNSPNLRNLLAYNHEPVYFMPSILSDYKTLIKDMYKQ